MNANVQGLYSPGDHILLYEVRSYESERNWRHLTNRMRMINPLHIFTPTFSRTIYSYLRTDVFFWDLPKCIFRNTQKITAYFTIYYFVTWISKILIFCVWKFFILWKIIQTEVLRRQESDDEIYTCDWEVTTGWRMLHSEVLHDLQISSNTIKIDTL